MSFRKRYVELVRRHIARVPSTADGATNAALLKCEKRLGVTLPQSMREYYLLAGNIRKLNQAHNRIFGLTSLKIGDGYLVFMEENQAVVHWAIPVRRLSSRDPVVWQRVNEDGEVWFSERLRFSHFLIRMFDWQAGFAEAPER